MKKINAFFLTIILIVMFSCATEDNTRNVTVNPNQLMSALKVLPSDGQPITANDNIELYAPTNASDAVIYYEIAVGTDCPEPTTASTTYTGSFTLSSKNLSPRNDDIITLKILAVKSGFDNGTLTLHWIFSDGSASVIDNNAYLKSVTISNVNFSFSPEKFIYSDIKVPNSVASVSIDYEKSNTNALVYTSPSSLKAVALTAGMTNQVLLTVMSADRTTTKRYSFSIYRGGSTENIRSSDCSLSSLSVDGASIGFDKNKLSYEVQLPNSTEKTSVRYSLSDNKAVAATTPSDLENISLAAGETKVVSIKVTAEDGTAQTYTISIYRATNGQTSTDATLKSLSVTGGSLPFNSSVMNYNVEIPSTYSGTVSVNYEKNHAGATVTSIPVNLDSISVVEGTPTTVTIIVTAEDKATSKTYKINLTKQVGILSSNANLSSITLSAGSLSFNAATTSYSVNVENSVSSITVSAVAEDSKASVNITPSSTVSLTAGSATAITIYVTAEDGTPKTYTISVTRAGSSSGGGGSGGGSVQSEYYWTNKNGAVGTNKTISSWSDWTEAERIAQCAAYDDPRTWTGLQEVPYDVYALYAAYDDTNLYVMVELTNIVDRASFMFHNFAASDNAWWNNRDIPLGLAINTGAAVLAKGSYLDASGKRVWGTANDGVAFEDANGFDWLLYHSSKYGTFAGDGKFVGAGTPGVFHVTDNGYFSYDAGYCLSVNTGTTTGTSGIDIKYMRQCAVSKKIYFESTPTDNRKTSAQTGEMLMSSSNYTTVETNDLDMSYWYTIPLKTLGMTKADVESRGIGIRQLTTGGGSLMDCAPWDPCMVDVAGELYSGADDNTSKEKEDCDKMTTPQARVGHM